MKTIRYLILISCFYCACGFPKKAGTNGLLTAGTIRFHSYASITPEGERSLLVMADSMARAAGIPVEAFAGMAEDLRKNNKEFNIVFNPDTIWRIEKSHGVSLNRVIVNKKDGTVTSITNDLIPRVVYVHQVPSLESGDFKVTQYKSERKNILGYECHKVIIERKEKMPYNFPFDTGVSVAEVFVTDKIDLPIFTLFSLPQGLPFFPLEIRGNLSNLPGVFEIYEAKEIKASKKK